jgi:hypothetical protein
MIKRWNATMLKQWWIENRYLLTKRTLYTGDCLIILLLPIMRSPYSYVAAMAVVVSLVMFYRDFTWSHRQTGSDR